MNYLANSIYRYPFMQKMTMAFWKKKNKKRWPKLDTTKRNGQLVIRPKKLGLRDDANFGGSRFLFRQ